MESQITEEPKKFSTIDNKVTGVPLERTTLTIDTFRDKRKGEPRHAHEYALEHGGCG